MSKSMLVNVVNNEESRIALVANGRLEELSIETAQQEQIEGNIYKARIVKVIASLDAVFVDYGRERNGFLAAPDIHPQNFRGDKRDVDALRKGQDLLVQVKKGEIGNKGAALTTYVSLPGRHFVLMPLVSKRGVSRKIDDEATRKQLRKILDGSGIPEEMGYIARTAAEGRTKQELTRDAGYLLRLWKTIQARYDKDKAPALLYQETDIVIRTLRDYFTPSIEEVLIDDEGIYRQVESFFQAVMPTHKKRLKLHQAQAPLFSKYNLEDQIASIFDKTVPLPSGGSLVIEQTEALVSIDVNSGKTTSGKDIEETALIANKEAAEEAARQLRLRDMGGLIVIDFIDMRPAKNRSEVRKILQKALKEDKARTDTGTISKFGLLELSRQRIKGVARAGASQACPTCNGLGTIRTPESSALSVLRRVQLRLPRKGAVRQVLVGVPAPVANLLQNRHRDKLMDMESRFNTEILVFAEEALAASQFYLEYRMKDRPEVETDLPEGFNRGRLRAPQGLPDLPQRTRRPALYPLLDEEPDTTEVPAEPETGEEAEAQEGTDAGSEEAAREPTKKRRRRRRRGRGNGGRGESADDSAAEPTAEPSERRAARSVDPGHAAAEAAAAEADAEAEELEGSSEPRPLSASAKRRQRRKRATARTRTGEDQQSGVEQPSADTGDDQKVATAQVAPDSDSQQVAEPSAATSASEERAPTEKSKRPRRPRRRKSGAEATEVGVSADIPPVPLDPVPDATAQGEEHSPAVATSAEEPSPTEKPRRARRPRRRRPSAETAESGESAVPPAPTAEDTTSGDVSPEASASPVTSSAEEPTPAEKPKRARRPRKPKTVEAPAAESSPAVQDAASDAGVGNTPPSELPEKVPAKPRRTRKKVATGAPKPEEATPGAEVAKPPKAPRKTRSRAKPKTEQTAVEPSTEALEPVAKKAPAKRAPRTRKAPAKPKATATTTTGDEATAPKKAPRRRKTTKAAAGGEPPAGSDTPTE